MPFPRPSEVVLKARRASALVSCLFVLSVTACTNASDGASAPKAPAPPATFAMATPKGGVDAVLKRDAVTFTAKGGVIDTVELTRPDGTTLPPTPGDDGLVATWAKESTRWRLSGILGPKATYQAKVTGHNGDGTPATKTFTVKTGDAPLLQARMNPGDDNVVGVGMPIQIRFDGAVPDRKAAQRALTISTTPKVEGSWGWTDDETVLWRPKSFWPAGTKVRAGVDAAGHYLGKGVFGGTKRTVAFSIGRDLRMTVSDDSHSLTVTEAGKKLRTFGVSLGRPGHTTRSGTKIVYEKHTPYTMRGEAADPYVTTVKYAQRITDSGEFLHAAPWSVGDQGVRNVSHGCTNLSPGAAQWLYGKTLIGDPVITTGTGRRAETWNGLGGIWNYSWPEWQKLSAL